MHYHAIGGMFVENVSLKRSIIVGIVFLFLSIVALPVLAQEGKPDLTVDSMGFTTYGDSGWQRISAATIKNIGDVNAEGIIYVKYTFTQMFFGVIPIRIVRTDTNWVWVDGGLQPQKTTDINFAYESGLPKFGFFEFKCTVNPGRTIEESNYSNNDLSQNYIAIFGYWIQIT